MHVQPRNQSCHTSRPSCNSSLQLLDCGIQARRLLIVFAGLLATVNLVSAFIPVGSANLLTATAAGTGLGYGALWSLAPAMVADRYGTINFGKAFGILTTGPALTTFIFNEGIAAKVYEAHTSEGSDVCTGVACFWLSLLVVGGMGAASAAAAKCIAWEPEEASA
jgi:MFS family permease